MSWAMLFMLAAAPASAAPPAEKDAPRKTRDEDKIDSRLLQALSHWRGQARSRGTPPETGIEPDSRGRVLIDVRAEATPSLRKRLEKLGGTVVSQSPPYRSTLAKFPLDKLLVLARFKDVQFIEPAAEAVTQ